MLYKLKQTLFIIISICLLNSCQTRQATTSSRKPKLDRNQRKQAKKDLQKRENYYNTRKKEKEKNYNRQTENTKISWDLNNKKSKYWLKNNYHNKSLFYRIKKFFERFKREPIPKDGLFAKNQKKKKKKRIFKRIFKRDKKKK